MEALDLSPKCICVVFTQISSLNTVRKYGTPAEIKKPRGADLHRMDPIINPSRKRKKKNRRSGGIDDTAALEADVEKLQKTRNLCFTAINNLETKLTREMKNINVQQAQFEVGCLSLETASHGRVGASDISRVYGATNKCNWHRQCW